MSHQDQTIAQPINIAMITMLRACGFEIRHNTVSGQHLVEGTIESAIAFYTLTVAGADANTADQPDAAGAVFARQLIDSGAENYIGQVIDTERGDIEVIARYISGKTPAQKLAELEAKQPNSGRDAAPITLTYPATLTADLAEVMGMPNFRCSPIAHVYHAAGLADIDHKAEAEQAFVIDKLVRFVITHGADWREHAQAELNQARELYLAKKSAAAMTQERFNEKMDALDDANFAPLAKLEKSQPQR